jgi:hypothetical protein
MNTENTTGRLGDIALWWADFLTSLPMLMFFVVVGWGGGYVTFQFAIVGLLSGIFVAVYEP